MLEKNSKGGVKSALARQRFSVSTADFIGWLRVSVVEQRTPKGLRSSWRNRQQIVIVQTEHRALKHRRERQIVFRQRQKIAEYDQILYRDLIGQRDPIGARYGNATSFQCGDHRHGERIALADEDQDVTGADRAIFRNQAFVPDRSSA